MAADAPPAWGASDLRPIQVIQAFQRLGYAVERVGGGHFVLEHPSRPPFQVPYRSITAMAPGFIRAQLRVAGLTEADFAAALSA
jgi:predicted RNA binding protein YcfA (HicA-like mRNA interferase family)